MDTERTANITIGGEEFTLLLTTKATKEIAPGMVASKIWAIS